jgi:anaerobic magnesium-protoporphyrin IX monomethyl ester cyclase
MKVLLVVYDNDSYIHWFPLGLGYIAAALRNAGHEVSVYSQDRHHYPDSHLTTYLNENHYDVVGVSVVAGYYQYRKLLKISAAVNASTDRPFYIIGGHGPAPEPEFFLKKTGADAVVIGEGEITAVNLLDALEHKKDLSTVKGIAFLKNGRGVITESQPLIEDIDSIAFPAWDLFPMDYYALLRMPHIRTADRCAAMITGRGCPFKCNFCYRMDKGIRVRSPESVIQEVKALKSKYGITYLAIADELTMASRERTKKLCEGFIQADLNVRWTCNGRLNYAEPETLSLMKKAGCVFINYGIECMDDDILKVMNKHLTVAEVIKGIEATLTAGISPGYNIIFGNIGENAQTLQKGVDFLLKYDDHSQLRTIRPVTPYPGSPLYDHAIKTGLLKDCEDFYEHKHLNSDLLSVNFTSVSDDEFHRLLFNANKTLLENYFKDQLDRAIESARKLYLEKDVNFRGFRQT